jgi:putative nucleotidyltransferase with HDIG domain
MSVNINKEFSGYLFERAFGALKENRFFSQMCQRRNIPSLFKEIKEKVGAINMPSKIDAIGTTLEVFAQIIDMKHPYASGHSLRVSRYAMACALAMNLEHDEITRIKWAGLIHDIGKLSVTRRILDKPTELTRKEFNEVKKHAQTTHKMMEMISTLKEITPIASAHHEYFDGSGYPLGLKGSEIPLGARILTICDAFDAMTSNRPYRNPLTPEVACWEIEKRSATQFDPEIVKYAIPLFRNLCL